MLLTHYNEITLFTSSSFTRQMETPYTVYDGFRTLDNCVSTVLWTVGIYKRIHHYFGSCIWLGQIPSNYVTEETLYMYTVHSLHKVSGEGLIDDYRKDAFSL